MTEPEPCPDCHRPDCRRDSVQVYKSVERMECMAATIERLREELAELGGYEFAKAEAHTLYEVREALMPLIPPDEEDNIGLKLVTVIRRVADERDALRARVKELEALKGFPWLVEGKNANEWYLEFRKLADAHDRLHAEVCRLNSELGKRDGELEWLRAHLALRKPEESKT